MTPNIQTNNLDSDYFKEGNTLDHFPEDFPTVSRELAVAVLELAKQSVSAHADSVG